MAQGFDAVNVRACEALNTDCSHYYKVATDYTQQILDDNESDPSTEPVSDGIVSDTSDSDTEAPSVCPTVDPNKAACKADKEQVPKAFKAEETFLIFDWDDTICPSSWVQSQSLRLDDASVQTEWHKEQLALVTASAIETLRLAKQQGTVIFVTNAERGWIELSCQMFMPSLLPMLENVKLLSARSTFERLVGPAPLDWKVAAFNSELNRIFGAGIGDASTKKNILSLGDGMHEREALLRTASTIPNCRAKALKFVERPDINQLCKQHQLINSCFEKVIQHDGNLDLCIRCN